MVFQKTLDYGFVGYQAPQIPRATRSARKRGSFRKQIGDNPMSAFDLLATVAGNLLLEKESSPSSSNTLVKKELESVDTPLKVEDILNVNLEKVSQAHISLKNFSHFHNEDNSGIASVVTPSECSEKVDDLEYTKKGILLGNFAAKVETSHDYVLDDENKEHVKLEGPKTENASISNAGDMYSSDIMLESNVKLPFCDKHITSDSLPVGGRDDVKFVIASVVTSSECSEKIDGLENAEKGILLGNFAAKVEKSHDDVLDDENKEHVKLEAPKTENTSISSAGDMYSSDIMLESNVKLQLCDKHITSDSLPVGDRDDVKLVIRDDDENSSQCTKLGTGNKAFRPLPRVGDLRIRKLLASKYWKVTSKSKEVPSYMTDSEMKSAYECRKICYKRYRSQRDYPFKKRRLYRCSSASNSDGGFNGDNVVSLPRNGFSFDDSGSGAKVKGGSGISARVVGQTTPLQTRDSLVKLRIKSFKVPELFIEIPENATVGNLKRTVLEAVTAALGGGLRVGVLLQGKKIRDDDRTLQQTGISHDDMLEALGFSLESNSSQVPSALQHEDGPSLLPCDSPKQIKRYPTSPREACRGIQPKTITVLSETPLLNLGNFIDSDHDSTPSPPDMDSKALVAAPSMNAEALNMVPLKKSKQSNSSQRRIRRPFSVTEVEALVQAVENLGTGRWRDVKLKAFDNAKHRTYVDLKDKWKTLVHTARISPQQRRGEQVPQELLDRVLSAHAYWSQQQVKQQLKHHSETCLLFLSRLIKHCIVITYMYSSQLPAEEAKV